ncbi:MAG: phosphate ABC transporter permease subunit PstC [Pseudomonadota bacterium]
MGVGLISLIVLLIGITGFVLGRRHALSGADEDIRKLHSLPSYYGQSVFLFAVVPALIVMVLWLILQPIYVENRVTGMIDPADIAEGSTQSLVMADVRRIASGLDVAIDNGTLTETQLDQMRADLTDIRSRLADFGVAVGADVRQSVFVAAKEFRSITSGLRLAMTVVVIGLSAAGMLIAHSRINPDFRARNVSERAIMVLLILASSVAILTTVGIIFSMVFETLRFFTLHPASDFFFNLTWNPQFRGGSELGIAPLLWGTLYVSFVALLFAVPIGLMAAIYMAEYASNRVRSVAKPMIEILAGIPTIVYGLFALITVGPLLRDYFAAPLNLGNSSSSVMTAGIVMGIMLIPFVSSLSDDIINAVPQAMRDGSYGLGATKSETIRQVIVPAALPGIIGAILLAASRAIGETMIVVMGAGAAAKLSLNPFEAMTTITVKIVSQLTGDTAFGSPETLVAFALGLSLFVITLGLNVLALWIVRRYREQYE